jgi:hypothetical protein
VLIRALLWNEWSGKQNVFPLDYFNLDQKQSIVVQKKYEKLRKSDFFV